LVVSVRFSPTSVGSFSCTVESGNSGCGTVTLQGVGEAQPISPNPDITSILDVGNDQGRVVRITFARSGRDALGSPTPILQYEIYRRIDELPSAIAPPLAAHHQSPGTLVSDPGPLLEDWDFVGTVPAHGDLVYNVLAPTLADSTLRTGMHWSVFFVRAATAQPLEYFDSPPDSGYSKDNRPPGSPAALTVTYQPIEGNFLEWTAPTDPDLYEFRVYRDTDSEFSPTADKLVYTTPGTSWHDAVEDPGQYHYLVTALDWAGNEGPPIEPNVTTGIGGVPTRSALRQNVPNPFNPSTTIAYDVGSPGGRVKLEIFDVRGQRVRTLVDATQAAGSRSVHWDGRDERGRSVVSGLYFCRLQVGAETFTRKMTVVQ
jgi:hypothetical protein